MDVKSAKFSNRRIFLQNNFKKIYILAYSPCVATGAQNLNESITISETKSCKTTGAP
jgi:hypothetical protein